MTPDPTAFAEHPDALPNWEFANPGPLRERLNGLALAGRKTGTFSLVVLNEMYPADAPSPGARFVMRGTNGAGLALIESLECRTLPISEVTWEQVDSEGESFLSVAHWREAHEDFWSRFTHEICAHTNDRNWRITDGTPVTYETFRVVEKLPGADSARFPVVELAISPDDLEWVSSELYDLGTIGIEELPIANLTSNRSRTGVTLLSNGIGLRAGFPSDESAAEAEATLDTAWNPRFEVLLGDDWLDAWREHFEPTRLGRFMLLPGWWTVGELAPFTSVGSDLIPLVIDPGRSFGTGAHPTTELSLAALEHWLTPGQSVLDVGCGSGVLSVAAALLGASPVVGVDVEAAAVDNTRTNAERNGVAGVITASTDPVGVVEGTFDVVVANILAPVLIALADEITRRVTPGGRLILAGLIAEQRASVVNAYERLGLMHSETDQRGNWVGLVFIRRQAGFSL